MSILKGASTVSFFISLSRIFGFIRDILIAQFVGVSFLSDVFFAAFRLPNFFRRIFGEGALNSAFVPIFIEVSGSKNGSLNSSKKNDFARNIFSLLFYILLLLILLFQIFMPFLMKIIFPGFAADAEKFSLLVDLSRITIFYLFFISLVALCSSVLNSMSKFAVPASAPIILNITLIFFLLFLIDKFPNHAYALSWAVFTAGFLQFSYLMIITFKNGVILYPKPISLQIFKDSLVKKFFKKMLPAVIGANVMQINLLVDSIFASLIAGALSYLYYADRVNQLPLAMIGIAIGIALLPAMSRKIKKNKKEEAIKLQNLALEVCLILVIPAAFALSCLSYPIISVLFERGAFSAKESEVVAHALRFYAMGLPAYVMVKVMEPAFFSRGDTKTPMKIAFVCLFANVAFNLIFFMNDFGYIGIVLSSVCSSYLNLTLLISILMAKKLFYFQEKFAFKLLKILIPALLMLVTLFVLREYFLIQNQFAPVFELIFMIFGGIFVYFICSYFSGSLNVLKSSILKRSKK